jgi:hypothetical protein
VHPPTIGLAGLRPMSNLFTRSVASQRSASGATSCQGPPTALSGPALVEGLMGTGALSDQRVIFCGLKGRRAFSLPIQTPTIAEPVDDVPREQALRPMTQSGSPCRVRL